jgi:hypothetical protein
MRVFILKEGKEYNQGVAYLDDGTMVVVDNAKKMISRTIDISVTSVLQTTAGKMIFGRFDDRVHAVHDKSRPPSNAPRAPREQPRHARRKRGVRGIRRRSGRLTKTMKVSVILAGRRAGHAHGTSRPRKRGHQPQAVHAAGWVAHPAAHHPEVCFLARGNGDRGRAAPDDIEWVRELLASKIRQAGAAGGRRRQPAGIGRERAGHAGARHRSGGGARRRAPVHRTSVLEKVFAEAAETGAAIVGIVPVDTVKQVHRNKIRQTIPRERLILAQTPQVFRFDLLKSAFEGARGRFRGHRRIEPGGAPGSSGSQRGSGQRPQHQDHQAVRHGSGAAVPGGRNDGQGWSRAGRVLSFRMGQGWDVHRIVRWAGP